MENFIPINRNLFKHHLWKEKRSFSKFEAWLDLLQMVSFSENNKMLINGSLCNWNRGQFPISYSFLNKRWNWSVSKIRTFLNMLKVEQMISIDHNSKITILTICKYEDYNTLSQGNSKKKARRKQGDGRVMEGIKEYKEYKEDKQYKEILFEQFWNLYNKKEDKKKCLDKWLKLEQEEIDKIFEVVENYVKSKPEVKFRKNPLTWLSGKNWNDEIEVKKTYSNYKVKIPTL